MTVLRNPDTGSIIQATGRLEARLLDQGWAATDQPASPGLRLITAAELDQLTALLNSAISASQTDRTDLRSMVEPMAVEVDQLTATVEATTTAAAPKPTPRTDELEAWRTEAQAALDAIQATVAAIDIPAAVEAWLTANPPPAGDYAQLTNLPTLGSAASRDTGTGATQVVLGNDARLTDARPPTSHSHPAAQVTGLASVATSGAYSDLSGKPTTMAPTAHTHPAGEVTGLHAVATSGSYADLTNKPAIPAAVNARKVIVNTAALTANTVKNIAVSFSPAMPDALYAVAAVVETSTPHTVAVGLVAGSRTVNGCTLAVRSTAAVNAQGLNVHCLAIA